MNTLTDEELFNDNIAKHYLDLDYKKALYLLGQPELSKKLQKSSIRSDHLDNCDHCIGFWEGVSSVYQNFKSLAAKVEVPTIQGKRFTITGKFSNYTQEGLRDMIQNRGGLVHSATSRKIDYVIAGSKPGEKYRKAKQLGIKTINEATLTEMFAKA
jgi:NAD-dependent DNA ligase